MLILHVQVDAPDSMAMGIKESLAMELERFGDVRRVSVERMPETDRQMRMDAFPAGCAGPARPERSTHR